MDMPGWWMNDPVNMADDGVLSGIQAKKHPEASL